MKDIIETETPLVEYKTIELSINLYNELEDYHVKFSDLEEIIDKVKWEDVRTFIVRDVPVYRDPNFETDVTRYIFYKVEVYDADIIVRNYASKIFG